MRQQVSRHEGAIAVAADGHAIAIRHTTLDCEVDGRLRSSHDLLEEGVVHRLGITHDRHRGVVEHSPTLRQQEQVTGAAHAHETMRRTADLASGGRVVELQRIGPHEERQALSFFAIRRQVQRGRKLDTIRALVLYELLRDTAQLGARIGIGSQGFDRLRRHIAQLVVRRHGRRLQHGHELRHSLALDRQHRHQCFVGTCSALPQALA